MSIRPDVWIEKMSLDQGLIDPFVAEQVRTVDDQGVVSYGLSSFGYDIRVDNRFRIFTNVYGSVVDPKHFDTRGLVEVVDEASSERVYSYRIQGTSLEPPVWGPGTYSVRVYDPERPEIEGAFKGLQARQASE